MSIRNGFIILIILILIPIVMEKVQIPLSDFFKNPKDAFGKLFQGVWSFYKNLVTNWIGNIIEERIKGKKIEIEIK